MDSSPYLCTVALSLLGGRNKICHDHEGAVSLKVRGRALSRGNIPENPSTAITAPGTHMTLRVGLY